MFKKKRDPRQEIERMAEEFAEIVDAAMQAAERKAQHPDDCVLVVRAPGCKPVVCMREATWARLEAAAVAYLQSLPLEETDGWRPTPRSA